MTVYELNRDQLTALKQDYWCKCHPVTYWGELAEIDELVSDAKICAEYADMIFCAEDFCAA